ncbi:MAG: PAS domain S-box protein [Holophaga sp.]|nr:PAS domain S-box protein [Holophaga sp.]
MAADLFKRQPQDRAETGASFAAGKTRGQGFFEAMVEHLPEAVAVLREGTHVQCNPAYARLFGFAAPTELIGRSLMELLAPRHAAEILARLRNPVDTLAGSWLQEAEGITQEGGVLALELSGHPFRQGNTVYYVVSAKDLRLARRAQQVIKKGERWWRHLFRMSLVGMGILGRDGRILAANESLCVLAGLPQAELLGREWQEFVPDQHLAELVAEWDLESGQDGSFGPRETFFCHPNGKVMPVRIDISPEFRPDGQVDNLIILIQNLREDRHTERRLWETEDRYRRLFDEMSEGYALHEIICSDAGIPIDYRFLEVNPAWEHCTGLKGSDVIGRTALEVLPQTEAYWIEAFGRVALSGESMRLDQYSGALDKHFSVFAQCPRKGLFSVVFLDITELKKQEEKTALLLAAVEQSPASIVITDTIGAIEYVNPKFSDLTGYSAEEAQGQNPRILKTDVQGPEVYQNLWKTLRGGQTWKGEFCNRKKNGELYWEQATISPILHEGRVTHFLAVKEDITEHRALQASQMRLVEAVDQAAELMLVEDKNGRLINANQAFVSLTGLDSDRWRGKRALSLLPKEGRSALVRSILNGLRDGKRWHGKLRLQRSDGTPCTLSGTISKLCPEGIDPFYTCVFRDITTELEMDRHLRQVEKMEALGALASGVAHDFNNVLTAIMSSAELIEWQLPEDSPVKPKLSVIMQAANRAKDLNRRILSFSRPSEERRIPFDLTAVVKECLHLLSATISRDVEVRSELSSSVWTFGDPAQIHQVVMNLAVNSVQAIDGKGVLELSLAEVDIDEGLLAPGSKASRAALLTVRDSGRGMDAETLDHVFEPFYSTKVVEGGSGLGLSVVHSMITQHGGGIAITSELGKGTLVKVYLPSAAVESAMLDETPSDELRGTEHIMVVDIEAIRAALTKESLQHLGYSVTAKSDPLEALDAFKEHPAIFDVVLLEYSKGTISAEDFAARIRKIRPSIAIILASGSAVLAGAEASFDALLPKPFSNRDLGHALRKVLDARKRAAKVEVSVAPTRDRSRIGEILIAEDSPVTLSLLRSWLVKAGYRVRAARDGQEAWEIFSEPGAGPFSLVLSDLVMPRMDGIHLVERIREVDSEIPVVLLSSSEDVDAMKSALHLQVSQFLTKPFDSGVLIACVERLAVGVSVRQRSAETAQAVRMAQRALVAVPEKDLPLYSVHQSLTDAGGDVFRCFKQPDGSILFILADVAGHSVISSYAVAAFLGLLSSLMMQATDLATLASRLNRGIQDGPFSEVPVCTLLGHWTPSTGRLHVVNAGLPHGLCGGPSRSIRIATNGTPLGVFDEAMVEEKVIRLAPGDRVFFASDGFFDIRNADGELMDDLALNLWCEMAEVPIQQAVSILAGIAQTLAETGLEDDLLAVGFEQPALEPDCLSLVIPSNAIAIDGAIQQLTEYLAKAPRSIPLTHSRTFEIILAAREALTNAMIHGNQNRPESLISVHASWRQSPPAFLLNVVDEGQGFELKKLESPTDPLSERGRGIPYLRHCASWVEMVGGELSITFSWEA